MHSFEIASDLLTSPQEIWPSLLDMTGINAELAPLSMTFPHRAEGSRLDAAQIPLSQVLFHSWVMLWGLIPLDRHSLCLTEVTAGAGFHEQSTTWLQRCWIHDRRLAPLPQGCRLTDRISFEPRLPLLTPLLAPIVRSTFERRHRHLRRRFGTPADCPAPRCQVAPPMPPEPRK